MAAEFIFDKRERAEERAIGRAAFILTLREQAIMDTDLLRAMELVPREIFAPLRFRDLAHLDIALPLLCGQTMTSPLSVAHMLLALKPEPGSTVLEIGTGSGYVSALLVQLGCYVVTVERHSGLKEMAEATIAAVDFSQCVEFQLGNGLIRRLRGTYFDYILLNGSLLSIPDTLIALLKPKGRLVGALTTSEGLPKLVIIERQEDKQFKTEEGRTLRLTKLLEDGIEHHTESNTNYL